MAVFFVVKGAMPVYGCTPCILELKKAFRDLVVRSFCVSRFTVNKKAPKGSNSHRFSSPAFPRLGCSLPLCLVSLLTR